LVTSSLFSGWAISDQLVNPSIRSAHLRGARSLYTIDLNTTTPYPHQNVTIYGPAQGDNAGTSVATGDVDGDGTDDIIIGADTADGIDDLKSNSGEVYVIRSGSPFNETVDLALDADITIFGPETDDRTGVSVATGDINGDLKDDIIIGATGGDGYGNSESNCGEVYVIYGSSSLPTTQNLSSSPPDVIIYGVDSDDNCGGSLTIGDLDGDNIDDIIMGAENGDGAGDAKNSCGDIYVIYGSTTLQTSINLSTQADITIYGAGTSDFAGNSLSTGEFNGDTKDDIIIGAHWADGPGNSRNSCGEVYLVYGKVSMPAVIDLASQADVVIYGTIPPTTIGSYMGESVAAGDVNGDGKDDILMGAPNERLTWYIGAVHILYGNHTLPLILDLEITPANITIYGDDFMGMAGFAVAAGDINGDTIDEIVLSAPATHGPGNSRNNCGEVYIINGSNSLPSYINLSTFEEDMIIYGDETYDQISRLAVGKIDSDDAYDIIIGAPIADGPNNTKTNCGEVYLILSSGEMIPKIKTEFLGISNGDGNNKKTCYAKYKPYNFKIKVTDPNGFADLNAVTFGLDFKGENLQFGWTGASQQFVKINDPNDYVELNSSSNSVNDGVNSWTLDFNITFNWIYPDNDLHGVQIYSLGTAGLYDWLNITGNIYQVENHLNFNGTVNVTGTYQGQLNEGGWLHGGEQLTWGGLKVVYNNTNNIYPPIEAGVKVTIIDSFGNNWIQASNPGQNISHQIKANETTKLDESYKINITSVPPASDLSNISYNLNIDGDKVSFSDPSPLETQWHAIRNPLCKITVSDLSTLVDASSVQYRVSTNNGFTWQTGWIYADVITDNQQTIQYSANPLFIEGTDNLIQWRARDTIGNEYNESEMHRVAIDVSNVTFYNPTPTFDEVQYNLSFSCNITVFDNLSGVNGSSVEFRFSTAGIFNYGPWQSARQTLNGDMVNCSVTPIFEEGDDNYIQWRGEDLVGNGPFVSGEFKINAKLNVPPVTTLLSPSDGSIIKTLTPELIWKVTDEDGDSPIFFDVYLSTVETQVIDLDHSALMYQNILTTHYQPETQLTDTTTYYWTVIPNDVVVDGSCTSGVWSFKIDTHIEIPTVTLISPFNNSNVSTQTPNLSWNINYSNTDIVSYTVLLYSLTSSESYNTTNYEFSTFMQPTSLTRGVKYYWTIIPVASIGDGKIQGRCNSGIWCFNVGFEITHIYGIEITLETNNLIVKQGEYAITNITVTNTGNNVDMIDLGLEIGIIDANIALEHEGIPLRLNASEGVILKLEVKIYEDTDVDNYTLKITAISNGALSETQDVAASKTLRLQVIAKDIEQVQDSSGDKGMDWTLWAALIVIIIVILLALMLFIYRKKKAKEVPVLKAEIEYKPPTLAELPGLTTPAAGAAAQPELPSTVAQAQPQVASGVTAVPALAPTPGQGVPQLPQATLSKAQQLNLLRERFLKGEVTEETYNKLRAEIETPGTEDKETVEDISLEGEGEEISDAELIPPTAEPETPPPIPVTPAETKTPQPTPIPDEGQQPDSQPEIQVPIPEDQSQMTQPQPELVPKVKPPTEIEEE
jgi:uncharacterized membrane protein